MSHVFFPGRELPPWAEHVRPDDLVEHEVYFTVSFLDREMSIPELQAVVFLGRNLAPDDINRVYFQDASSYFDGTRPFDQLRGETRPDADAVVQSMQDSDCFLMEYEKAVEVLLRCLLRRQAVTRGLDR